MWVGLIQSIEGLNRTERRVREDSPSLADCLQHGTPVFSRLRTETWTRIHAICSLSSQTFRLRLEPCYLLSWAPIWLTAGQPSQSGEPIPYNKYLYIYIYFTYSIYFRYIIFYIFYIYYIIYYYYILYIYYWFYFSGELRLIQSVNVYWALICGRHHPNCLRNIMMSNTSFFPQRAHSPVEKANI